MIRAIMLCLLFSVVVPAFVMPERAVAAEDKILDGTITRYMEEASKWEPTIKLAAKRLFWALALISMIFTFGLMLVKGNTSLGEFFGEFLRFGISAGFFYWLMDNGSAIANAIIKGFAMLGKDASSTYQEELSTTNILWFGLDLIVRSVKTFGEQDLATSVVA